MNISPKSIYEWYRGAIRNPKYRWWIILGSLLYIVSPIDISPDLFPIAGQIDDIMILSLLLVEVSQVIMDFARSKKPAPAQTEAAAGPTVDVNAVSLEDS